MARNKRKITSAGSKSQTSVASHHGNSSGGNGNSTSRSTTNSSHSKSKENGYREPKITDADENENLELQHNEICINCILKASDEVALETLFTECSKENNSKWGRAREFAIKELNKKFLKEPIYMLEQLKLLMKHGFFGFIFCCIEKCGQQTQFYAISALEFALTPITDQDSAKILKPFWSAPMKSLAKMMEQHQKFSILLNQFLYFSNMIIKNQNQDVLIFLKSMKIAITLSKSCIILHANEVTRLFFEKEIIQNMFLIFKYCKTWGQNNSKLLEDDSLKKFLRKPIPSKKQFTKLSKQDTFFTTYEKRAIVHALLLREHTLKLFTEMLHTDSSKLITVLKEIGAIVYFFEEIKNGIIIVEQTDIEMFSIIIEFVGAICHYDESTLDQYLKLGLLSVLSCAVFSSNSIILGATFSVILNIIKYSQAKTEIIKYQSVLFCIVDNLHSSSPRTQLTCLRIIEKLIEDTSTCPYILYLLLPQSLFELKVDYTKEIQELASIIIERINTTHPQYFRYYKCNDPYSQIRYSTDIPKAIAIKDQGNMHFSNSNFEDAITEYTTANQLIPFHAKENTFILSNRALCFLKLSKYDLAIRDCTMSLALDENNHKSLARRAEAFEALFRFTEALNDYYALKRVPYSDAKVIQGFQRVQEKYANRITKRICANCGVTHERMRKCAGCQTTRYCSETCQKAHWPIHKSNCSFATRSTPPEHSNKLNSTPPKPNNTSKTTEKNAAVMQQVETFKKNGNDYFGKGLYEKAIEEYSKAIILDPSNYVVLSNRSMTYLQLGKNQQALNDAELCIKCSDKQFTKGYVRKATALKAMGKLEEGRRVLQTAVNEFSADENLKQVLRKF